MLYVQYLPETSLKNISRDTEGWQVRGVARGVPDIIICVPEGAREEVGVGNRKVSREVREDMVVKWCCTSKDVPLYC